MSSPCPPARRSLGGAPPRRRRAAPGEPVRAAPARTPGGAARLRGRIGSALAAIAALIAKFFAAIKGALLLIPKFKLLTTAGTALVSVAAYSLWFGWTFAVGFVVLLFVHEMGHVMQLRREGIKASAPMFIPFLGAVVMMRQMPDDALAEARVGLAGPVLGTLGAAVCLAIGEARQRLLPRARLHRLLPEPLQPAAGRAARRWPRDGGDGAVDVVRRASACWSRWSSCSPARSS